MKRLDIELQWVPVFAAPGEFYRFPAPLSRYCKQNCNKAGVYCWRVQGQTASVVYVGEAENLAQRLGEYIRPGRRGTTHKRIHDRLIGQVGAGAGVTLEALSFEPFTLAGVDISENNLSSPFVRRFLENLAILAEQEIGNIVLNEGKDLTDKQIRKLATQVHPTNPGAAEEKLRKFLLKRKPIPT